MSYFDVRIPSLRMTVIQADGQNIRPIHVDQFRIAPGKTFDVLVHLEDRAYAIFCRIDGSQRIHPGNACGAFRHECYDPGSAARPGPHHGRHGMGGMAGMEAGGQDLCRWFGYGGHADPSEYGPAKQESTDAAAVKRDRSMAGMARMSAPTPSTKGQMVVETNDSAKTVKRSLTIDAGTLASERRLAGIINKAYPPGSLPAPHDPDRHGAANASVPMVLSNRLAKAGKGFSKEDGKVLTYTDLSSPHQQPDQRGAARTIELHLTGNMDRYVWSFDGKKYSGNRVKQILYLFLALVAYLLDCDRVIG